MNPGRVVVHDHGDQAAGEVLAATISQTDRAAHAGITSPTGRATQAGDELWPARLILCGARGSGANLGHLLNVVDTNPDQSGTAVVVHVEHGTSPAGWQDDIALVVELTPDGRVRLPSIGLDLIAAGLTADEALGIAALLEQSHVSDDEPVPVDDAAEAGSWRAFVDEAGALRPEYTQPRAGTAQTGHAPDASADEDEDEAEDDALPAAAAGSTSLLPAPDTEYLHVAATTTEDQAALAPQVPSPVMDEARNADPELDADLAAWLDPDCRLPKLSLLGPVKARTRGRATAVVKSKDYYTELLAYLATRRAGATLAEIADAFSIAESTARKHLHHLREWLGTNPRTGGPHLPDARKSPAAKERGLGVYQVQDLLVDADLFRRLRMRGQASGVAGMGDLCTALRLVRGTPLEPDSLRPGGWAWMLEGDRLDQHLLVAVVDVAHLITTSALRDGDLDRARNAAELAALAAPDEEIPQLDLVAIATTAGQPQQTAAILLERVTNRSDDASGAPGDLPSRTRAVMSERGWNRSAS